MWKKTLQNYHSLANWTEISLYSKLDCSKLIALIKYVRWLQFYAHTHTHTHTYRQTIIVLVIYCRSKAIHIFGMQNLVVVIVVIMVLVLIFNSVVVIGNIISDPCSIPGWDWWPFTMSEALMEMHEYIYYPTHQAMGKDWALGLFLNSNKIDSA